METRMRSTAARIVLLAFAIAIISFNAACPGFLYGSRTARRIIALEGGTLAIFGSAGRDFDSSRTYYTHVSDAGDILADEILEPDLSIVPFSVSLCSTGDILFGGRQQTYPWVIEKACVMRVTATGEIVWFEIFPEPSGIEGFGIAGEVGSILELPDQSIAIAGRHAAGPFHALLNSNGKLEDFFYIGEYVYSASFITKTNHLIISGVALAQGFDKDIQVQYLLDDRSISWNLTFPHFGAEESRRVIEAANSDVVVSGGASGSNTDSRPRRFFLLRIASDGDLLWEREYEVPVIDGALRESMGAHALTETGDGSLYTAGTGVLIKLNPDGDELWRIPVTGTAYDVTPTNNGGVWVAGGRLVSRLDRAFLMKVDEDGTVIFDREY